MPPVATAAVAFALGLDLAVAEPPARFHPVAVIGRGIGLLEREWSRPRLVGVLAAILAPLSAASVGGLGTAVAADIHPLAGGAFAGLVLFSSTSLRMLLTEASHVVGLSETDLPAARERLPALVGRAPGPLGPRAVRSAAIESSAENLADGLVGPLLAFSLLAPVSLPLAAGGAVWVKTVNTMDSVVGYPDRPVGWASARLDDAVMWVPARVAAVLLALAARSPATLLRARQWASVPASPNAGWPMSTLAVVLGTRLEKPDAYVLNGDADPPTIADGRRGVGIVGNAGVLAFACAGVVAWI